MSTVILLSSSPPRVFARSPTPVSSSPRLPSPGALIRGESPSRKKFKTTSTTRDRFSSSFSSARQVLAVQHGAENKIISSPGRNKFRLSQTDAEDAVATCQVPWTVIEGDAHPIERQKRPEFTRPTIEFSDPEGSAVIQIKASDVKKKKSKTNTKPRQKSPLLIQRAVARRLDWTPPRNSVTATANVEVSHGSLGLASGLLDECEYTGGPKQLPDLGIEAQPTKRRKLDGELDRSELESTSTIPGRVKAAPQATNRRGRSPVKKGLTITGLATSKCFDLEELETTPMMQYLASTQAEMQDALPDADSLQDKINQTKVAARKLKGAKAVKAKSRLVSPSSAMRSFEQQDAIFGSASQLARDESPTFLRDIIEATKQSEASFSHDFSSPQRTQAISIDSTTPRQGTLKFRKTRNLWAAAGRDEDNALLHIDTVDLVDSPALRHVFTGKDAMIQPGSKMGTARLITSNAGQSPLLMSNHAGFADIDNVVTPDKLPSMQQSFSTSAAPASPRKKPALEEDQMQNRTTNPVSKKTSATAKARKAPPKKPNYAGFTDGDLKKQISAYGFKAIKKREKMIELLDKCWEEKNGLSEPVAEHGVGTSGYGDILSHVHDVLARPVPKAKKPRAPRKKKEDGEAGKPAKAPRKRKKKADEDTPVDSTKKPTRKRKAKTCALSEEIVHDIEDVDIAPVHQGQSAGTYDGVGVEEVAADITDRPPTPPPTGTPDSDTPLATIRQRTQAAARSKSSNPTTQDPTLPTPQSIESSTNQPLSISSSTPPPAPIQDQIGRAIFHQSHTSRPSRTVNTSDNTTSTSITATTSKITTKPQGPNPERKRNHQVNPTWHEKFLLYDPIILEDLATWLNTEGLRAIDEDREVSAVEVRTWCEERGICCLWRGGWRGQKGRGDGGGGSGANGE